MRRFLYLMILTAIVGLSGVTVAWSAQQHGESPSQIKLAHNRRTAHADAVHLLKSVRLPPATRRTTPIREHRGFALEVVRTSYVASAKYLVPANVNAYAFVMHHRPHGTKLTTGFTYHPLKNGRKQILSRQIYITFPNRPGVLFVREAMVNFKKLPDHKSKVSVTSQSSWVIPRPSAEKVPKSVTRVVISGTTHKPHSSSSWAASPVTAPSRVRKLSRLVDRPGITQDVTIDCPAEPGPYPWRSVTLRFENASRATLVTVSASWSGKDSAYATGNECSPLTFSLRNKSEPSLADPNFLAQLHKLTGVKLDR